MFGPPPPPPSPRPPHLQVAGDPRAIARKVVVGGAVVALAGLGLLAYGLTREGPAYEAAAPSASGALAGDGGPAATGPGGVPASLWIDGPSEVGTKVVVDGDTVGTMPLWLDRVAEGSRRVQVLGPDGRTLVDTVLVAVRGVTTDLVVDPLRAPAVAAADPAQPAAAGDAPAPDATGDLRVTSSPSGATVALNGRRVGETPLSLGGLRPGRHAVSVARPGFEATTQQVDVSSGRALDVAVSLRALDAPAAPPARAEAPARTEAVGTGTLEVLVQPWGRIVIDGATHRRETDVVYRTTLPAGSHTVAVSHPQLGSEERTVVVQPGVQTRIEFDLRGNAPADGAPTPGPSDRR